MRHLIVPPTISDHNSRLGGPADQGADGPGATYFLKPLEMSDPVINSSVVIAASVITLLVLFLPRVVNSTTWRATVTPLASIIGSGFLVLGPILKHGFGEWGILVMGLLCGIAYLFGEAIRFNIAQYEQYKTQAGQGETGSSGAVPSLAQRLESLASIALTIAYVVSIAYYLNLFGAFAVSMTSVDDETHARIVTTAALAFVGGFGWLKGFSALERLEEGTVGLKLAIICGLLVGFVAFFIEQLRGDGLYSSPDIPFDWQTLTVALGLVITVQGFETSRYLGGEFDAATRIRTMKMSQWISTSIYIVYIALTTYCFTDDQVPESETGIIGMTRLVAPVLPVLLVVAALAAQFSAAVADTGGCGGLTEEVTGGKVKSGTAFLIIAAVGIALTWVADIYSIIAYASRAFAAYYTLQCAVAAVLARRQNQTPRALWYAVLSAFAVCIVIFGSPAE